MRRTISREHRAAVVVADLRGRAAVVNWNGQSWLARGGAVSLSGATISALPGIGVKLSAAETRRNIATTRVPLNHLVGREFWIGAVRLRGTRLCEPCRYLEGLTQPGAMGRVLTEIRAAAQGFG